LQFHSQKTLPIFAIGFTQMILFSRHFSQLLFAAPLLLLTGCIYEPDGENPVLIEKPNLEFAHINLNAATDTIFMHQSTFFSFVVGGIEGTPESFTVYVDDKPYKSGPFDTGDSMGNFVVDASEIGPSGYHKLRVEFVASSGTGSLADQASLEKVVVQGEWTIELDITKPDPLAVTLDTLHGTLTLNWSSYSHRTFQKYIITKKCRDDRGDLVTCEFLEIEDPTQNSWTDTKYIGGEATYQVDIAASIWWVNGLPLPINSKPNLRYELDGHTMILRWNKLFYHNNLSSVIIRKSNVPLPAVTDFTSTTFVTDFHEYTFGNDYSNGIEMILQGSRYTISHKVNFSIGKKIDPGEPVIEMSLSDLRYNATLDRYFCKMWLDQRLYFVRLDPSLNVENRMQYWPRYYTLSENGEYGYMVFDIVNESMGNHWVHRFNPLTLDTVRDFSMTNKFGISIWLGIPKSTRIVGKMMVSDNNLLAFQSMKGNFTLDMPSTNLVTTNYYSITTIVKPIAFSADGKYVFDNGALYQITNDIATTIESYPVSGVYLADFRSDKPHELVITKSNGDIDIVDVTNMTVRTIALEQNLVLNNDNTICSYDPISGYFLLNGNNGKNYMVHLDSQTWFQIEGTMRLFVANGKVISGTGYVADIDLLKSMAP
jgi:hypothetical protein